MLTVKVKKVMDCAELPFKATKGSVGADLRVYFDKENNDQISKVVLQPNQSIKASIGLIIDEIKNAHFIEFILLDSKLPIEIIGRHIFTIGDEISFNIKNTSEDKIVITNGQILGRFFTLSINNGELIYAN